MIKEHRLHVMAALVATVLGVSGCGPSADELENTAETFLVRLSQDDAAGAYELVNPAWKPSNDQSIFARDVGRLMEFLDGRVIPECHLDGKPNEHRNQIICEIEGERFVIVVVLADDHPVVQSVSPSSQALVERAVGAHFVGPLP
jgi:hypothetical protein